MDWFPVLAGAVGGSAAVAAWIMVARLAEWCALDPELAPLVPQA